MPDRLGVPSGVHTKKAAYTSMLATNVNGARVFFAERQVRSQKTYVKAAYILCESVVVSV